MQKFPNNFCNLAENAKTVRKMSRSSQSSFAGCRDFYAAFMTFIWSLLPSPDTHLKNIPFKFCSCQSPNRVIGYFHTKGSEERWRYWIWQEGKGTPFFNTFLSRGNKFNLTGGVEWSIRETWSTKVLSGDPQVNFTSNVIHGPSNKRCATRLD